MDQRVDCSAVADRLEATVDDIVAAYENRLREQGNRLVDDPRSRDGVLAQGRSSVAEVCAVLRDEGAAGDGGSLTQEIGAVRAAGRIHPTESIAAAGAFADVVIEAVVGAATAVLPAGAQARAVAAATRALHFTVMDRMWQGATAYAGFLLNSIHEAHTAERRRVARELHDRVGSTIASAMRSFEVFQITVDTDPVKARERVDLVAEGLAAALDNVRQVASDLRLTARSESLEKALLHAVETIAPSDVDVHVMVNGDEAWVPGDALDEVFLVTREAMRNAFRHGAARTVTVRVDIAPHELRLVVRDDGVGFTTGQEHQGSGRAAMRERVELLGGRLTVASRPGRGTTVEAAVPLAGPDQADG